MVKLRVNSSTGPVITNDDNGFQVAVNTNNKGFTPYQVDSVLALTGGYTLVAGEAGVITVAGGSAATIVMPLASACPGAEFVVRSLSAQAHLLTGSQETGGVKVFSLPALISTGSSGSRLTFAAAIGTSVCVKSDGVSFLVMAGSGSTTIAGA